MIIEEHHSNTKAHVQLAKVRFILDESDAAMGVEAENLWARRLGEDMFKIDNIPFYVYGISNEDIVSAVRNGLVFDFQNVIRRGGHSTYRVLLTQLAGFEGDAWKTRWPQLEALGCRCEVARKRWIAIDVPKVSNADDVYALLEKGRNDGVWSIDEGHCGHPL